MDKVRPRRNLGWADLPLPALERIFCHLDWNERFSASLVCKNWSDAYRSPSFWRSPMFYFPGSNFDAPRYSANKFVKRYGRYFRHLEVKCQRPTFRGRFAMQMKICKFLRLMAKMGIKLDTLVIRKLTTYHSWRNFMRTKFLCYFRRFMRKQTHLRMIDLSRASVFHGEGLRILKILSTRSGKTLKKLDLADYFRRRVTVYKVKTFANVFRRFTNLRVVALNYNMLSDYSLKALAVGAAGKLTEMTVSVRMKTFRNHTIMSSSWRKLKNACPELRVNFEIEGFIYKRDHARLMPPEVPLRSLDYSTMGVKNRLRQGNMHELLDYLHSMFYETLEKVRLNLTFPDPTLPEAIRKMFPACHVLEDLDITMPLPVFHLPDLFNTWLTLRPPLKTFTLLLLDVGDASFRERIKDVRTSYLNQLKVIGLQTTILMRSEKAQGKKKRKK